MTERKIQLAIIAEVRASIVCACPNYTPMGWWECDLWTVTKAGYPVEYEIKRSIADFKADARKGRYEWKRGAKIEKHTEVLDSQYAPSRFFYAVPREIQEEVEPLLPEWAGLVVVGPKRWSGVHVVKPAPQLNKRKVQRREIVLAQRRMWYRYWESIAELERMKEDRERMAEMANGGGA